MKKIVIGITGASGAMYGIHALQILAQAGVESHLVISTAGMKVIEHETNWTVDSVEKLATAVYRIHEIDAPIASGSYPTNGMIVIPCSMKTLSGIANSYNDDLIIRAADVTLKEGRPLLLSIRETPLHRGHLRIMDLAIQAGAIIAPPIPAFYGRPSSIDEMVDETVRRNLIRLGIVVSSRFEWKGISENN